MKHIIFAELLIFVVWFVGVMGISFNYRCGDKNEFPKSDYEATVALCKDIYPGWRDVRYKGIIVEHNGREHEVLYCRLDVGDHKKFDNLCKERYPKKVCLEEYNGVESRCPF